MKDANGFYVDVTQASLQLPQDRVIIRINVDDLDEGYALLKNHGFENILGEGHFNETETSRGAIMRSPSGFTITLIQHIK